VAASTVKWRYWRRYGEGSEGGHPVAGMRRVAGSGRYPPGRVIGRDADYPADRVTGTASYPCGRVTTAIGVTLRRPTAR
jgi:hypothetical protein